ncbi:MAG TPA: BadF/BadG/BcrA/BcrD ATPase family protein [Candidatus Dormibacteraeota bacterium]|nr:BadF/BadG/BcrA/BcrD ATPase family protein [Candidatus Dormibacteraeota bacterium]
MKVLAIDGGQGACRAAVYRHGRLAAKGTGGGYRHHRRGRLASILEGPRQAIEALGEAARGVEVAALGLSGFSGDRALADAIAAHIRDLTGAARVLIANDAVTAHAGALQLQPGVVVAAGTGVIALAVADDGRWARADGRGYLLGDAGSGFAIGQAGLHSALNLLDGRGGSPALLRRLEQRFGSVASLHDRVYGTDDAVALIAGFAEEVAQAAREGDEESRAIWRRAAQELTRTALAAARRVFSDQPFTLSWNGRLLEAEDLLLEPWLAAVRTGRAGARCLPPAGDQLAGARLLGEAGPSIFADLVASYP